jgi:hypothetical protein
MPWLENSPVPVYRARVVDEDLVLASMVGVDALNREVEGDGLTNSADFEARHPDNTSVSAKNLLASRQLVGPFETLVGDRPEGVIFGGADDLAVDDEVDDGVVVDPGVGHCRAKVERIRQREREEALRYFR